MARDRVAALNRQKGLRVALLRRQCRLRLERNGRQLKAVDSEIARTLAGDEELARRAETLASIPGVGKATAAGLLAAMPEPGGLDAKAAASLAGLAPVARESGQWQGKRFIQGGRARARRLLYMAAVAATRHNPDLGRKYRDLIGRGKPPKVAGCTTNCEQSPWSGHAALFELRFAGASNRRGGGFAPRSGGWGCATFLCASRQAAICGGLRDAPEVLAPFAADPGTQGHDVVGTGPAPAHVGTLHTRRPAHGRSRVPGIAVTLQTPAARPRTKTSHTRTSWVYDKK